MAKQKSTVIDLHIKRRKLAKKEFSKRIIKRNKENNQGLKNEY